QIKTKIMKKLLLILTLLITSVSFSQKEFQESFSTTYNSLSKTWFKSEVLITFNLNNNERLMKLYIIQDGRLIRRTSEVIEEVSSGGIPFSSFTAEELETGERIVIEICRHPKMEV